MGGRDAGGLCSCAFLLRRLPRRHRADACLCNTVYHTGMGESQPLSETHHPWVTLFPPEKLVIAPLSWNIQLLRARDPELERLPVSMVFTPFPLTSAGPAKELGGLASPFLWCGIPGCLKWASVIVRRTQNRFFKYSDIILYADFETKSTYPSDCSMAEAGKLFP